MLEETFTKLLIIPVWKNQYMRLLLLMSLFLLHRWLVREGQGLRSFYVVFNPASSPQHITPWVDFIFQHLGNPCSRLAKIRQGVNRAWQAQDMGHLFCSDVHPIRIVLTI